MRPQRPQFAHRRRGHPDRGNQVRGRQARQFQDVAGIGLDPRLGDPGHLAGSGHEQLTDEGPGLTHAVQSHGRLRTAPVVEVPRVRRGFDHQHLGLREMRWGPLRPAIQINATRRQHHGLMGVDATNHQIVLVQIHGQVTFRGR